VCVCVKLCNFCCKLSIVILVRFCCCSLLCCALHYFSACPELFYFVKTCHKNCLIGRSFRFVALLSLFWQYSTLIVVWLAVLQSVPVSWHAEDGRSIQHNSLGARRRTNAAHSWWEDQCTNRLTQQGMNKRYTHGVVFWTCVLLGLIKIDSGKFLFVRELFSYHRFLNIINQSQFGVVVFKYVCFCMLLE